MSKKKQKKEWKDLNLFEKAIAVVIVGFIAVAIVMGLSGAFDDDKEVSKSDNEVKSESVNEDEEVKTEKKEKDKKDMNKEMEKEKNKEEKIYSLGFDAVDFKDKFNSFSKEIGSPFNIDEINVTEGEVQNVASIILTDNVGMNLTINKADNSVREVVVIGQGDGSEESGYDIMLAMGTVISVTNPSLDEEGRGNVLRELGLMEGLPDEQVKYVEGDVRYTLSADDVIGVMFIANNKDDN